MNIIKLVITILTLSTFVKANEISFNEIIESKKNSFSVSFFLEKISYIKSYSLEGPSRLVFEVYDSNLLTNLDKAYDYPIKKIRAATTNGITKIVLDLYEYVEWKKPTQIYQDGKVVLNIEISKVKGLNANLRDIIVAIDAGHGGRDPGAVSSNNVLEKDVTLLISRELERTLRDTKGYQAIMIRDDDNSLSLNDRYKSARKYGADIFISIHADGFRLASVKGASVFVWSENSSSSVARNLSEKERKRIQAQIKNIESYDFDEDAARELYPNAYKEKIDRSKLLGVKILDQFKSDPYTKIHKKNVEFADFRVLKSVDIPSVLIESGFLTNPEDAKRLKSKAGRRMLARSIFLGINEYYKEKPLLGTYFENYPEYLEYQIQKGDVLSEIAIRFGVTVNSINQSNNLFNKSIFPGQLIRIKI